MKRHENQCLLRRSIKFPPLPDLFRSCRRSRRAASAWPLVDSTNSNRHVRRTHRRSGSTKGGSGATRLAARRIGIGHVRSSGHAYVYLIYDITFCERGLSGARHCEPCLSAPRTGIWRRLYAATATDERSPRAYKWSAKLCAAMDIDRRLMESI